MPKGVFERSDDHRRHISEALKGKPKSEEHARKVAIANTGKRRSEESRRKTALGNTGKKHPWTDEQKAAMAAARKDLGSYTLRKRYGISLEEQMAQRLAGNKWCSEHKGYVPAEDFPGRGGGKQTYCKSCAPAFYRRVLLRTDYKVDAEWYASKLAEQGGGLFNFSVHGVTCSGLGISSLLA